MQTSFRPICRVVLQHGGFGEESSYWRVIKTIKMPLHTAYQQMGGHGAAIPAIYMQARTPRSYAAGQLTRNPRGDLSNR